jgi:hypothetical protein
MVRRIERQGVERSDADRHYAGDEPGTVRLERRVACLVRDRRSGRPAPGGGYHPRMIASDLLPHILPL